MKKIKSLHHYKQKYFLKLLQFNLVKKILRIIYSSKIRGSKEWLIYTELTYGGISTNVTRNKLSNIDPRLNLKQFEKKLFHGIGMTGGDRMLYHNYAPTYAKYLAEFLVEDKYLVLFEVGILKGIGMAIWCDLFQNSRIIGADIDLSHINNNMNNLKRNNAFKYNTPELHKFDAYKNNISYLKKILKGNKIDICIDDGPHTDEAILQTFKSIVPYLSENFVYFIEDNRYVYKKISLLYPHFMLINNGELTVILNK